MKYAFILTVSFLFLSCSGSSTKTAKISSGKWNLDKLNGSKLTFSDGSRITLEINSAEGRASGKAPCNSYSCSYDQDGNQLRFNAIISTKMACEQLNIESEYFAALTSVDKYKISGTTLSLFSSGTEVLVYEKKP